MTARAKARATGRPPKFDEPSRPVTMTLPERTLARLAAVDPDRASAIVKLVHGALSVNGGDRGAVEVVEVAPGSGVIVVAPSRCLRRIPWLKLAEVTPGRYLLTVVPGTPIESLEVAILDLLEGLSPSEVREREILDALRKLIRTSRRHRGIHKFEMLYVRPPAAQRRRRSNR